MKTSTEIKKAINEQGGLLYFSSYHIKTRPVGCPMKRNLNSDLQTLTNEELNIAFRMNLIK